MAYEVKVLAPRKKIIARKGELLADKLQEAGIPLSIYCDKRGVCGKCFVEIVKGDVPPLVGKEKFLIPKRKLKKNFRLACLYEIKSDLEISVPSDSLLQEASILESGLELRAPVDPAVKKFFLELKRPELSSPDSLFDLLKIALKNENLNIPFGLLKDLPRILEEAHFRVTAAVHRDRDILSVEPGDTVHRNYGVAIDLGTTTLVAELVDLNSGKRIGVETSLNSQVKHGADVVSRISYASGSHDKAAELRNLVLAALSEMINKLLKDHRILPTFVYEVVLAGNTTMNHLILGLSVATLAVAPYHALFSTLPELCAQELNFRINPHGKVHVAPNIKSFVGGDISAGLLASGLEDKKGNFLFIDLGTNGEIVLKSGGEWIAASTAAGPAFEGMNISCGMLALPGAIYKAEDKNPLRLFTIRHQPPRGICGTGLIDLVAVFLERGIISPQGSIQDPAKHLNIAEDLFLTQGDIRQVQLACAAIKTGIRMMLKMNDLAEDQLDGIYVAGAFGNYLNVTNSMKIGLLPLIDEKKVVFIGNSSLAGAKLLLLSEGTRESISCLVQKIRYISLASDPTFQDHFIKALEFRSWP